VIRLHYYVSKQIDGLLVVLLPSTAQEPCTKAAAAAAAAEWQ
jgi:hypothetical protein